MTTHPTQQPRLRGREVTRLEALSDAVFGFAATLLVVSLEVPQTFQELTASLQGFGAFAFSFTMLILIWVAHNSFFRRYGLQDSWTVLINSVLLFVVLFYVYPLKFLSTALSGMFLGVGPAKPMVTSQHEMARLMIIYALGFIAVFLCFSLLYRHAGSRWRELELDEVERLEARAWFRHYLSPSTAAASSGPVRLAQSCGASAAICSGFGVWEAVSREGCLFRFDQRLKIAC